MPNPGQESPDNVALRDLRDEVKNLNRSTRWSNRIMIVLTVALLIAAGVQIYFAVDYERFCAKFGEAKFDVSKFDCITLIDKGFLFGETGTGE